MRPSTNGGKMEWGREREREKRGELGQSWQTPCGLIPSLRSLRSLLPFGRACRDCRRPKNDHRQTVCLLLRPVGIKQSPGSQNVRVKTPAHYPFYLSIRFGHKCFICKCQLHEVKLLIDASLISLSFIQLPCLPKFPKLSGRSF